jgi:hypothetical protein
MQTLHEHPNNTEKQSLETNHTNAVTLEIRELRNEIQDLKTLLQQRQTSNIQA